MFGISTEVIITILVVAVVLLAVLLLVLAGRVHRMQTRLRAFMGGANARSLEDTLIFKLDLVDDLLEATARNERDIAILKKKMKGTFQKYGLVKYDALEEQGGKLSFTLALLDEEDDGIIMNMVHSREGCYCYLKEVIDGQSVLPLAPEENEALETALGFEAEHVDNTSPKSVKALKDRFATKEDKLEAMADAKRKRTRVEKERNGKENAAEEKAAKAKAAKTKVAKENTTKETVDGE